MIINEGISKGSILQIHKFMKIILSQLIHFIV